MPRVYVLAGLALAMAAPSVHAQFGFDPYAAQAQYAAGLQAARAQNYAANLQAASGFNPYAGFGSNPYSPISGSTGYGSNPYSPVNEAMALGAYGGYGGLGRGGLFGETGGALFGASQMMKSYGEVLLNQEQARLLREQYYQAKLKTKKERFDLEMYIRDNTPTFSEEQAKVAKQRLARIQTNSSPGEIASGEALNTLLNDLRRYPNRRVSYDNMPISVEQLLRLNVTKGNAGMGILRDEGKFNWPSALLDLVPAEQRKDIELQSQLLVGSANKGRFDPNLLKDLRRNVETARAALLARVNDIPTPQYLEAKRFLNDFEDAQLAIERGEAGTFGDYRQFVRSGKDGRTVQELVDYMVSRGLRFAPATFEDEGAYRAVHSALAAFDLAYNVQLANPETKE